MSFLRTLFGGKSPNQKQAWQVEYFENPPRRTDGRCSDRECPCNETPIPRGTGFVYIGQKLVDFRRDARAFGDLSAKVMIESAMNPDLMLSALAHPGAQLALDPELVDPILVCDRGARLRNLDLVLAAADAKIWWKYGRAPLRVTPIAGSEAARLERAERGLSAEG